MSKTTPKGYPLSGIEPIGRPVFDDAVLPLAVVFDSIVSRNIAALAGFCERKGFSLAPHGKTTMSPELFKRQLDAGAWAITAATVWQAAAMRSAGVGRVLVANVVVNPAEVRWMGEATGEGFEIYCYVDSAEGIEIMESALASLGTDVKLPVLVELGFDGGRTGARSVEDAVGLARSVVATSHLTLAGTAGFEGIIVDGEKPAVVGVRDFLDDLVAATRSIDEEGLFGEATEVVLSAGGSAFFDYVAERFEGVELSRPLRKVLRSGAYVTHDHGGLHRASPMGLNPRIDVPTERLEGAVEVWASVLSRPEPDRIVLGLGKRDISTDGLLPLALKVLRRGEKQPVDIEPNRAFAVNDQHGYLKVDREFELGPGDLVGFGISHPCTTFDKWRVMHLVDDDYQVIDRIHTEF